MSLFEEGQEFYSQLEEFFDHEPVDDEEERLQEIYFRFDMALANFYEVEDDDELRQSLVEDVETVVEQERDFIKKMIGA